ncbi:MAG: hypothetical protein ACLQBA_17655 [Candidatus Binataceae bacterium]
MNNPNVANSTAHLRLVRIRTLNEIAFIAGDRAYGGPTRETELAALRRTLHDLDERIAAAAPSR